APSKYGALTLYRDSSSTDGLALRFDGGITSSISFWYSTVNRPMTVTVLDANNNVLAASGANGPELEAQGTNVGPLTGGHFRPIEEGRFNRWKPYALDFSGTATTVVFNGFVSGPGPTGKVLGDFFVDNLTVVSAVPETSTVAMMLAGIAGLGVVARRRQR
ncbi:PEP-CTERM sorting domain-containing protein, partial [uncultured Aquincola sp.]|uniref:PEP-CTERM sorting domain-containing protein n=1 Tax=uncultured Aquincola sp. TaxID=886556 RepID=UPI0032B243C1